MPTDSHFHRLNDELAGESLTLFVDDQPIVARAGDSVAAAMLAAGEQQFRDSTVFEEPRGPWCLMGACYECVVLVNGIALQACMTTVRHDMRVSRRERVPQLRDVSTPSDIQS